MASLVLSATDINLTHVVLSLTNNNPIVYFENPAEFDRIGKYYNCLYDFEIDEASRMFRLRNKFIKIGRTAGMDRIILKVDALYLSNASINKIIELKKVLRKTSCNLLVCNNKRIKDVANTIIGDYNGNTDKKSTIIVR